MPVADVNGQSIHFADSGGDKPAILFSHGFLMDHTMFDAQVETFADYTGGWGPVSIITIDEQGLRTAADDPRVATSSALIR